METVLLCVLVVIFVGVPTLTRLIKAIRAVIKASIEEIITDIEKGATYEK